MITLDEIAYRVLPQVRPGRALADSEWRTLVRCAEALLEDVPFEIAPETVADNAQQKIVPSSYARAAKAAKLDIITWTLERSGLLRDHGGYYYQSVTPVIDRDGDMYEVLDVLATQVEVLGVFSDWPATVTYYANCMGL